MKYIIGISAFYYESSVALIENGELKEFLKEESFTRIKGTSTFPKFCLEYIKMKYSLNSNNIDACVFYEKPLLSWSRLTYFSMLKPFKRWKINSQQFKAIWSNGLMFKKYLKNVFNLNSRKIFYSYHHVSHALTSVAYARYKQNYNSKDKLIIVADGVGDGETLSIFKMVKNNLERIYLDLYPNSLGLFYSTITDFLGFNINDGEFKVMGLSGYGNPIYKDFILENIISFDNNVKLNMDWFDFDKNPERSYSNKFFNYFGKQNLNLTSNSSNFQKASNIASSFQEVLEHILVQVTEWGIKKTGINDIYFSGGIAHNSRAMAKIANLNKVKNFTVPPSPGDSGAALGAANYGNFLINKKFLTKAPLFYSNNFYYPKSNISKNLFKKISKNFDAEKYILNLLVKGKIICVFNNGAETGPRALGNRSIICSAKLPQIVKKLNSKIKKRESFRPLSPMILEKNVTKYFYVKSKFNHNLQWMGLTLKSKKLTFKNYKSCVHVDGTSRVQVINDNQPFYNNILNKLEKLGHEMLINTSFNTAGEPIVFDYIDCYVSMKKMNIKYLFFDKNLYVKV